MKQVPSVPLLQKLRTRAARSSRPLNMSASFGYRTCIDGRAATWSNHERSLAREGAAVTDFRDGRTVSSVNIGIHLY